jgi:PEP-CTERM motif
MTRRTTYLASIGFLAMGALAAPSAQAAYVVTFKDVGLNVVETGGGTIDLTGLTILSPHQGVVAQIEPSFAAFASGSGQATDYIGLTNSPSNFGSGGATVADTSSGDGILIAGSDFAISDGYVSGAHLSETSTYLDATLGSLGLTPEAYVYNWGSGAHADSLTIDIIASPPPVPEPSTWAMMLVGFATLGYAAWQRKAAINRKLLH